MDLPFTPSLVPSIVNRNTNELPNVRESGAPSLAPIVLHDERRILRLNFGAIGKALRERTEFSLREASFETSNQTGRAKVSTLGTLDHPRQPCGNEQKRDGDNTRGKRLLIKFKDSPEDGAHSDTSDLHVD
ncbi:hypothetical protein K0M31_005022 [Melipona bicolor]|uniref:Uncharacterized protein n=1 Tax=Melipona bicolor TaxID=60889 RepID=A0AA40KN47_9HYME|nr:hypothetical protein K0M31_005022 [Melipona bicolor]